MSTDSSWFNRLALVVAGILGAGGVAAAAGASHYSGDERVLGAVALVALTHAAAFLALGLVSTTGRLLRVGALVVGAGVCLFCIDLVIRDVFQFALMPIAAPIGGIAIIAGWTLIAVAGAIGRR